MNCNEVGLLEEGRERDHFDARTVQEFGRYLHNVITQNAHAECDRAADDRFSAVPDTNDSERFLTQGKELRFLPTVCPKISVHACDLAGKEQYIGKHSIGNRLAECIGCVANFDIPPRGSFYIDGVYPGSPLRYDFEPRCGLNHTCSDAVVAANDSIDMAHYREEFVFFQPLVDLCNYNVAILGFQTLPIDVDNRHDVRSGDQYLPPHRVPLKILRHQRVRRKQSLNKLEVGRCVDSVCNVS